METRNHPVGHYHVAGGLPPDEKRLAQGPALSFKWTGLCNQQGGLFQIPNRIHLFDYTTEDERRL
jgi:hypothetical protein